jgi:hypothetical protein
MVCAHFQIWKVMENIARNLKKEKTLVLTISDDVRVLFTWSVRISKYGNQ